METEKFKAKLETELATLNKELEGLGVHNPSNPSDWEATPSSDLDSEADPNDLADRTEDWNERRATLAVLETRYNNVTRALTKIDAGNFGSCEICNQIIEVERLEANPAARTCKAHLNDEINLDK